MSSFAALKALLDALFKCDDGLLPVSIHWKYSGQPHHRHPLRNSATIDMAMRAAHLVADVTLRILRCLIENAKTDSNAVAQRPCRDRRRVRRYPSLRGVSSLRSLRRTKGSRACRE